jgi:hypothetical protein
LYLHGGRAFPKEQNLLCLDNTIWNGMKSRAEFQRRKEADKESYIWDKLIELLADPTAKPIDGPGPELSQIELVLRQMAKENRLNRRGLRSGPHLWDRKTQKLS